jgi:hypothetical protein
MSTQFVDSVLVVVELIQLVLETADMVVDTLVTAVVVAVTVDMKGLGIELAAALVVILEEVVMVELIHHRAKQDKAAVAAQADGTHQLGERLAVAVLEFTEKEHLVVRCHQPARVVKVVLVEKTDIQANP